MSYSVIYGLIVICLNKILIHGVLFKQLWSVAKCFYFRSRRYTNLLFYDYWISGSWRMMTRYGRKGKVHKLKGYKLYKQANLPFTIYHLPSSAAW